MTDKDWDRLNRLTFGDHEDWTTCESCGECMTLGSWPFCGSATNPDGHSQEVGYGWHF